MSAQVNYGGQLLRYRIITPAQVAGDYATQVEACVTCDMNLDDGEQVTVTEIGTGQVFRVTVDHVHGTYTEVIA